MNHIIERNRGKKVLEIWNKSSYSQTTLPQQYRAKRSLIFSRQLHVRTGIGTARFQVVGVVGQKGKKYLKIFLLVYNRGIETGEEDR